MDKFIIGVALYERNHNFDLKCIDFSIMPINENPPITCDTRTINHFSINFIPTNLFPNSARFPAPIDRDVYLQILGIRAPFLKCESEFYRLIDLTRFVDDNRELQFRYTGISTGGCNNDIVPLNRNDEKVIKEIERRFMKRTGAMLVNDQNKEEKEMIDYRTISSTKITAREINAKLNLPVSFMPIPMITKIVFNNPATIVFWADGTKTVVKCMEGQEFNEYYGVACAIMKRFFGNNSKASAFVEKFKEEEE